MQKRRSPRGNPWLQLSWKDLLPFLVLYGLSYLAFRFEITRHYFFQPPMSNTNAALFGLALTVVVLLYNQLQDQQ